MAEPLAVTEGLRTVEIDVGFDASAHVYFVLASDLPGLHVEMPTLEGFIEVATDLVPDLLSEPRRQTRLRFRRSVDLIPADIPKDAGLPKHF